MELTREVFEELTLPHALLLRRLALRMVRKEAEADDLVQEAYLRAWKYRKSLDPSGNVRAWLCRILSNEVARNASKGKIQEADVDFSDLDYVPDAARVYMEELPDQEIQQALKAIPSEFSSALVLHAVEGFSYKEIAEVQGVAIGTVMSRLHRARQMMRKELAETPRANLKVVK